MWIIIVFLYLRALCTVSSLSKPVDVAFSSVNLRNVLHWRPASDSPASTHFTVQYAIYGDRVQGSAGKKVNWRQVWQCTDMARNWCDLTDETWDLEQGYYAKVRAVGRRASSNWEMTQRFDPKSDTTFGPPLVSAVIEENSIIITLKGPMRYQPDNRSAEVSMQTIYPHMTYNLSVQNTRRNQTRHFLVDSSEYVYRLIDYDTEYCFSAMSRFLSMPVQCQPSGWHCITTPQDPERVLLQRVVVGIVVASACMCVLMVASYLLYHYLRGTGKKSPHILDLTAFHPPPLVFPPEKLGLFLVPVIKEPTKNPPPLTKNSTSDPTHPKQQFHMPLSPPRHAPQGPLQPDEPGDNLSQDYGFVVVVPPTNIGPDKEESSRSNVRGEDGSHVDGCKDDMAHSYEKKDEHDSSQANFYHPQKAKFTYTGKQTHTHSQPHTQSRVGLSFLGLPVMEVGTETELEEKRLGRGRVEEGKKGENMPLLSAYTVQHFEDRLPSNDDPSDCLSDDYGVVGLTTAQQLGKGEEEEEDDGTTCVNWDPETRKLVLSEVLKKERGLDGLKEKDTGMGGEEAIESTVRLENVFVRQSSEEEAALQRGMESVDEIQTKWGLVISMDQ